MLDERTFDKVQLVAHIPISVPGAALSRFQETAIGMSKIGTLGTSGYSQYEGFITFKDEGTAMITLDLTALGPRGTAEHGFIRLNSDVAYCL